MVLQVRKKYGYFKVYKLDIWNLFFNALIAFNIEENRWVEPKRKIKKGKKVKLLKWQIVLRRMARRDNAVSVRNKYIKFFYKLYQKHLDYRESLHDRYIYRTDVKKVQVYRKYYNRLFLEVRIHKLYYITIDYPQFFKMRSLAAKKDGLYEGHICMALEGRIVTCFYRLNYFNTVFDSMFYVKKAYTWSEHNIIKYYNKVLPIQKFFGIYFDKIDDIKKRILVRASLGGLLFSVPRYIVTTYRLFISFYARPPRVTDINFMFDFNFSRILGYNLG